VGPHLRLRRYEAADADAVWRLHERALADAGTDPADVPGTDDLRDVETAYLERGGEFLVGVLSAEAAAPGVPRVADGALAAMGGYLPTEAGHADERSVEGAAELHRMRVAPAHQRAGLGRELLDALERRARAAGFELLVATTAARQRAAARFYPAEGYTETGRSAHGDYELIHFEKQLD
jgi:ribosomal protein S18 acetylase RimI-like enzyme